MTFPLEYLATFDRVAEMKSMSRAAEALSVTQPAISKTIRMLEGSLGARLFERGHGTLRLTEAGEVLASHARRVVAIAGDAVRALQDLSSLRRGDVGIAVTPTLGTYVLPDVLVHMRRRFPGIGVRVEIGTVRAAAAQVRDGSVDLALVDAVPDADGLTSRVFAHESLVIIGPPRHPLLRRRRQTSLARLSELPFVLREVGSNARSFAELALANHGVVIRPTLTLGTTEAVKRAVAGGLGFAVVPAFSVRAELAMRSLAVLRVPGVTLKRPLYVTTAAGRTDGKPAIAFLCLLKHGLRGSLPTLPPDTGLSGR